MVLMGKRELVALLSLSSWCLVIVVWLFLAVPWVFLQFVIVVFPNHTHLLFLVAIYIIIPGYHGIYCNKCLLSLTNLTETYFIHIICCYLNISFINSTNFDCLPAFQVINEKGTLKFITLFCLKRICHDVHYS